MKKISFYVHIPFCVSKCVYCAFLSFSGKQDLMESYVQKLKEEILSFKQKLENRNVRSIFFGGGSPSTLPANLLCDVLNFIKKNFHVQKNAEITVEANPESFDLTKAKNWKKVGVNRLSFGLQTDDDKVLKKLGRPHTKKDFEKAVGIAKRVGFKNINADILLGLEGQTTQKLEKTVEFLKKQNLTHISAYGLMVEDGTPLCELVKQKKYILPDEEKSVLLYDFAKKKFEENGFFRYEISNFAKKGFECKHNKNYWNQGEFVGFGLGAYSFFDKMHSQNVSSFEEYFKNPTKKQEIEMQTQKSAQNECVMLSLRTEKGLNLVRFRNQFGFDFESRFAKVIAKLSKSGLIEIKKGFLKITNFEVSNFVIEQFFV